MKRILLSFLFVLLTGFVCSYSSLAAAGKNITLDNYQDNQMMVTESNMEKLSVSNFLSNIFFTDIQTEYGVFTKLIINGYTKNQETGAPLLPVKRELIEIPWNAKAVVKITSYKTREIDLNREGITNYLYPSQPEHFKDDVKPEFVYNQQAYQFNAYDEKEIVSFDELGIMRGTRIGRINIAPVKYNPVQNKLLVYTEINFEVVFENADIPKTIEQKQKNYSPFFTAINRQLINSFQLGTRDNFMRYPVKYVIVSDPMFENQLQEFVEWKTEKGFHVIEAYTDDPQVGNTPQEIKSYLDSLYNAGTSEDPSPSFVLFVGDVDQIEAWPGNTGWHVTDLFYCEYTGDYFPEVYYGRFSAQDSAQLQPQIDKTIMYEKYQMPDPSYLDTVVMVAGVDSYHGHDWANGQINYGTTNYFNDANNLYSNTYLYPESENHAVDIRQNVSDGVAYGNYTAHCSPSGWGNPSFTVSHVPDLENQDQYGLLVGNCCSSNAFDSDACFGEALLRAENKGALGYIGGSNSTMWDPDYYWGIGVGEIRENPPPYDSTTLGAYDRMFHTHSELFEEWYVTQSEMIYAGNLAVTEGTPAESNYYWEIYCLMGDPSVMIYFGIPSTLTATYPNSIPIGVNTITINTEPYAYAGFSKDGILHGAALADSLGEAVIEFTEPITEPGTADIVITKQNRQPHTGTIEVITPNSAFIILEEYIIDDTNANNNGLADYGEDIYLDVDLKNIGQKDAINVIADISTADTLVVISKDSQEYGSIPSDEIVGKNNAFQIQIAEDIPDQHILAFDMLIEGESRDTWDESFEITVNAPKLTVKSIEIDDSELGNGDNALDPGETANLIIPLANTGHADIYNVISELSSASDIVTINTGQVETDTLKRNEQEEIVFGITVSQSAETGDVIDFDFVAQNEHYQGAKSFGLGVGLFVEDYESGNFGEFHWIFDGNADWTICEEDPWEGTYCSQSGDINDMQNTSLIIQFEVTSADSLSFYKKVSCEDDPVNDNYDFLAFYIDDVEMGRWDGEVDWSREAYFVEEGTHTFRWDYSKDYSVAEGEDCAWVDYIVFPPTPYYVGIEEAASDIAIEANVFPNPADQMINISLKTNQSIKNIKVTIYNSLGQTMKNIFSKSLVKGFHSIQIETLSLTKGIYYCVIEADNYKTTKKIIITR